ncbi:Fanconi anemia core complex-associated protein 100-like isoform X2 [Myxocyprinus asiaticus]|uniref:Fanconi anemia core complex-associated protein 100-like isoform X2 n=1 Tax=Myxocyprinus asiaticus TaxID=70543 RepID=UPI0022222444|nr:Fanconi anemia core complex-associated protein 100-like isoform X2 [Myxocyprinus asiaticus]
MTHKTFYDTNKSFKISSFVFCIRKSYGLETTVLKFENPVKYLAVSDDKYRLYALCENGGLYNIPLSPHPSLSTFPGNKSPDPVLYTVSDDSIVLKNSSLQAFTIVEKILVTLGFQKSIWSFDLFEEPESKPLHKLASFQVTAVNTCSLNTTEDVINIPDNEKPPVLACIYPEGSTSLRTHNSHLHPHLEPRLFRLLFGVDASLVNSPVILCGLPDGRICYFPLFLPQMAGPRGEQRSPFGVLQSLEQPIIFIGSCISGEQGPQCLVAVGLKGKLLMVRSKKETLEGKETDYSFNEHSIRGPVMCACVDDKHLYYSSLNDLQALQLTKTSSSSEATATESHLPTMNSDSLGICRIVALAGPHTNPTGSVQLLALSLSGKLLQMNLPQGADTGNYRLPSLQAGQRVKDLLASIGNVWEKAESLKHKLQEKNECLKRLNQVMNICSVLLANGGNEKQFSMDKQPIKCRGVARWSSMLQRDYLTLRCVLENASTYTLEQGWTLCIQVHPLSHSQCANMESSSRTYSFPFKKLDSGQTLDITIPLESFGELSLPAKVYCSLVFSLSALLGSEASLHSLGVSQLLTGTGSISVPLNTLTVDWLDALRLEGSFSPSNTLKHNTAMEGIQAFLSSRGVLTRETYIAPKLEPLTVVAKVSSELLKTKLHLSATSSTEICVSVLNWLVSKPEAIGQTYVQSPVVCAYSPDGCTVKLLAKEVTMGNFSSEGPLAVLEIRVESMSMAAACGLHHAILRRLLVLLGEECGNTKQLQAQSLCETVRHVESLYKDLQDAKNQGALRGTMKTNKTSEILFHIFLQLRANPLVIL